MSSQDMTLLLYDEQMQISSFSLFKHFPIKVNDVITKIIKIQELSSPKGE